MTTLGLKNVNMLSKEQYDTIAEPVKDELYAISGSGFGFPSSNFEDLELGASGTTYTAPANGWVYLLKVTSANSQYITLVNESVITRMGITLHVSSSGGNCRGYLPVKKGDIFSVSYNAAGATTRFAFIYAEGE